VISYICNLFIYSTPLTLFDVCDYWRLTRCR